jgi:ABC-type transporter Mla maintaining outer membrane lipid asymmetry ATPase subunit MlaF
MSGKNFNPAVIEMREARISALRDPLFAVLEDVNWTVLPGEFWVVAGPQYSGKTDLLMHAAGLVAPMRGTCRVFDCPTQNFGEEQIADRLRIGFVFAGGKLFHQMTVAENVALPLRYQKNLALEETTRAVEVLLELLELTPFAGSTPANLALNWRVRTALARALVLKPDLLVLDNPLGGLGARHRHWLLKFLDQLWRGHEYFGPRPMTIVAAADDLRAWRHPQRQFAVVDEKHFAALGGWREVETSRHPVVNELLAEPAETNT